MLIFLNEIKINYSKVYSGILKFSSCVLKVNLIVKKEINLIIS